MDGDRQILGNPVSDPYPNLFCVFVALGNDNTKDRYFIFKWKNLADIVINHHSDYLQRHGGMRPKAPKSTHCSISIKQLESYEDRWNLILEALAVKSE
jgi:hypothetical protein